MLVCVVLNRYNTTVCCFHPSSNRIHMSLACFPISQLSPTNDVIQLCFSTGVEELMAMVGKYRVVSGRLLQTGRQITSVVYVIIMSPFHTLAFTGTPRPLASLDMTRSSEASEASLLMPPLLKFVMVLREEGRVGTTAYVWDHRSIAFPRSVLACPLCYANLMKHSWPG